MNTATSPLRSLFSARARRTPAAADPADMGTCFGLEMTIDDPAVDGEPPAPAPRAWWQRFSPRKAEST